MRKPTWKQSKWLAILIIPSIITILIGSCATNQPPVISDLSANSQGEITPGASCQIKCTASDQGGHMLSYTWTANGGQFSGTGSTTTWTAPDKAGTYTITVIVSNGRVVTATKQLTLDVVVTRQPETGLTFGREKQ